MVELTVVVVPSTWKSPAITTLPVLSPTPAGSSVIVAGPEIVFDVTLIADPSAPVWNAEAVIVLEALIVEWFVCPVNVEIPDTFSCVASTYATVVIPDTAIAAKLAPCPPPRT